MSGLASPPPFMQAMVLDSFGGQFRQESRPIPDLGAGDVLVRVHAVGAGKTLEHMRLGQLGGSTPRILGHEFSGTIAATGASVHAVTTGMQVTASFYHLCGRCTWCACGRETLCENMQGYIGAVSDGAFAEYVAVPAQNLVAIPEGVPLLTAGVVADAIATPYHVASKRIGLLPGQRVAVIGAGGGLGVHMLGIVRAFGGVAIAVERAEEKAAELERRGLADVVFVPEGPDWAASLRRAAGGEIAAVVDTVGSTETLEEGVELVGRAGTFVVLGFSPGTRLTVDPTRLLLEEVVVTGTRYATRAEIAQALELVRQERIEPVVGATFPLVELNAAFDAIRGNDVFGRIVIECPDTADTEEPGGKS